MNRNPWLKHLGNAALSLLLIGNGAHAQTANMEKQSMQYSYTTNGAADGSINGYGNNAVSVSGDVLTVEIGDSDDSRDVSGVGIYELKLVNENLENALNLADLFCFPHDLKSAVAIPDLYIAKCNGEIKSSYVRNFSRDTASKIHTLMNKLKNAGIQDGRKVVKLDLSLISIERGKDGFFVSFRFVNTGNYPIKFTTPDKWNIKTSRHTDILGVSGYRVGGGDDDQFGLALAGRSLADPKQFPVDGEIELAPHSFVLLKMRTNSISKFLAGTYDLNIGAFMNIEVVGIQSNLLRVDFHSDYKKPTRITFDRDYPSTPEEREQWEAYQRTRLSCFPVKPGKTFAEDGMYRAVTLISGVRYRSLQVKPFKAGDVATADNVEMPMDNGSGVNIDGPVQWEWHATAPTPIKQWSLDMIEDTQQFCAPDSTCPRSGRWVARIVTGPNSMEYRHDLSSLVTLNRGEPMPSIRSAGKQADWEWVGA